MGAIEPQFYKQLLERTGLEEMGESFHQMDQEHFEHMNEHFSKVFASRTRNEWTELFRGTDACVAPILLPEEIMSEQHNLARNLLQNDSWDLNLDGEKVKSERLTPTPAPRFSRSVVEALWKKKYCEAGEHTKEILEEIGYTGSDLRKLLNEAGLEQDLISRL